MSARRREVAIVVFTLLWGAGTLLSQDGPPGQAPGFVAYPQRPPGDPAAIERGKGFYGVNCVFCHGADARGGDGGGPNLLRSTIVLEDQKGERIAPVIREGRGGMPPFQLTDAADRRHRRVPSQLSREQPHRTVDHQHPRRRCEEGRGVRHGEMRVVPHHGGAARPFAAKLDDPKMLQQMWLMPGNAAAAAAVRRADSGAADHRDGHAAVGRASSKGRSSRVDDFT